MLNNVIVVYDFETGSADPHTCQPIELAALAINPYSLDFIKDEQGNPLKFESLIRPTNMDTLEEKALQVNKKTKEQLEFAPEAEGVWHTFDKFVAQFNFKGKRDFFSCPISAGHNILNFDRFIIQRMCEKYGPINKEGKQALFHGVYAYDTILLSQFLFNGQKEPGRYNMDSLREFYGMSSEGGHTAITDVKQTGQMLIKYLKLAQRIYPKVKYKGSMADEVL